MIIGYYIIWLNLKALHCILVETSLMEFQKVIEEVPHYMDLRPLKPKQLEVVQSFVWGQDSFVALPMG